MSAYYLFSSLPVAPLFSAAVLSAGQFLQLLAAPDYHCLSAVLLCG